MSESIIHQLVNRGRYPEVDDAWRAFVRWALVESVLPEAECRKALRVIDPPDPLMVAEAGALSIEEIVERAVPSDLLSSAAREKWFCEWWEQPHVAAALVRWSLRPGQSTAAGEFAT